MSYVLMYFDLLDFILCIQQYKMINEIKVDPFLSTQFFITCLAVFWHIVFFLLSVVCSKLQYLLKHILYLCCFFQIDYEELHLILVLFLNFFNYYFFIIFTCIYTSSYINIVITINPFFISLLYVFFSCYSKSWRVTFFVQQ